MRRKAALVVLTVLVALTGGACGRQGNEINEIGLIYEGGTTQEKTFRGFLEPGSTWEKVGWGSKVYRYRIDQRSYRADAKNNGADAGPVSVASKDTVQMSVDYQLYFKLNRDPTVLRKFHENLGVKTSAWTDEGWKQMLRDYFEPQIERSLEAAALNYNMRDLYSSEETRVAFQNDAVGRIKQAIKTVIGDDYFCGPSYNGPKTECSEFTMTVGKPEPPDAVKEALQAEQTNAAAVVAQTTANLRVEEELKVERELVALYGPQGALLREAIKSGKVQTFIVDPNNTAGVNASSAGPQK